MTLLTVRFYTELEEERARRFRVLQFYIVNICGYLEDHFDCLTVQLASCLSTEQKALPAFQKINRKPLHDNDSLTKYLYLSWASEIQLRMGALTDTFMLRYTNCWAPVHAYYSIYMLVQAWFLCMGEERFPDNHTDSLRMISNQLKQRRLLPQPWSVLCSGCPQTDKVSYPNLPDDADSTSHIEVLSRPTVEDFWPRYCKMLRTTREKRLESSLNEWKRQNNRKKMYAHEKEAVANNVAPTTLFDFFWRLRIRANYRDVSTFLMSSVDEQWHQEFSRSLLTLTESTCVLLSNLIVKYSGSRSYLSALEAFLANQLISAPEIFGPFSDAKRLAIS
jgi:hypothetical protein